MTPCCNAHSCAQQLAIGFHPLGLGELDERHSPNLQFRRRHQMKVESNGHATAPVRKEQSPPMPRRILLVDDDEDARDKLRRLLQIDPHLQIDAVSDGEQALKAINDVPYSLVITDLR